MFPASFISSKLKPFLNQRKVGVGKVFYFLYWYNCWLSYCETDYLMGRGMEVDGYSIPRPNFKRALSNLKINGQVISDIDDAIVDWKYCGWYHYSSGKQREVKAFKPEAIALFQEIRASGYQIPSDILRKFYHGTRDCETIHLMGRGMEVVRDFYNNTVKSPFRWYHPLQNTKKEEQPLVFKGCTNIDVTSCFLSLYWFDMGGKDVSGPDFHFLLNPHLKKDLEQKIATDFGVSPDDSKTIRNNLTSCNTNGHVVQTGIQWYDDLHNHIIQYVRGFGKTSLKWSPEEATPYLVFTFLEMKLMDKLIRCGNPVLRMHDGIIFSSVDEVLLRKEAHPHIIKKEQW